MGTNGVAPHDALAALDLGYPGLEAVLRALDAGDRAAAQAAYLAHYRQRRQPVLHWHFGGDGDFVARSAQFDFFAAPPELVTWRDRERLGRQIRRDKGYTFTRTQGSRPSGYALLDLAAQLLDNRVFLPYSPEDGLVDLGSEWDWERVPAATGRRWTLSLCYQYFLRALAQAYWLTGAECYIAKLVAIAIDYVGYVDGRSEWLWIPDMQLALNYQQLMPFILSWPGLAAADFCTIQGWLADGCAASMEAVEEAPGNQGLYNGLGLLWLGIGMPECKRAGAWRERGFVQIADYFGDAASYPDGSSRENSYGYVVGASREGLRAWEMAAANGWPFPGRLEQAIARRAEFLADVRKPDGSCPWTGDGQRGYPDEFLRQVARVGRRGAEWLAGRGSALYRWGGVGIMRGVGAAKANYLFFDVGPLGTVHAHEGKLAVEVVAYGRSIVEDLGVHSYSREPREKPWYRFFGHSLGHNTVVVDGLSQMRLATGPQVVEAPLDNLWWSTATCDYLAGSYEEGYGAGHYSEPMVSVYAPEDYRGAIDRSLQHRRSVCFVKAQEPGEAEYWIVSDWISGMGGHICEALYHLVPGKISVENRTVRTMAADAANLALIPVGNVEVEVVEGRPEPDLQGWYCGGDLRPVPAPCVVHRCRGALPQLIQTVLWPLRSGESDLPRVAAHGDDGWLRIARPDGGTDIFCAPRASGAWTWGQWRFAGAAYLARLDRAGARRSEECIGPEVSQ